MAPSNPTDNGGRNSAIRTNRTRIPNSNAFMYERGKMADAFPPFSGFLTTTQLLSAGALVGFLMIFIVVLVYTLTLVTYAVIYHRRGLAYPLNLPPRCEVKLTTSVVNAYLPDKRVPPFL